MFSVALMKRGIEDAAGIEDLCPVAGVGLIRACVGNENGTSNLVLQGLARVRLVAWTQENPFRIAKIEIAKSILGNPVEADALEREGKRVLSADRKNRRPASSESDGSFEAD